MNETPNTPEPLADIIAEMRDLADHRAADAGGERPGIELLRSYADRIEAAAKQEAIDAELKWTRIGYDERKAEEKRASGNAAAMRAALEKYLDLARRGLAFFTSYRYTEEENDELEDAFANAKSAIAAPARNVDRFASMQVATAAWNDYKYSAPTPPGGWNECDLLDWLLAPAKGGAI